jgi:uncharacterized membrane protein YfcA
MYFPVADITVNPLIPPLVAFVISFFTSMGGVSGAFLLLPFQVSVLGFQTPAVSSTNQLFNIVAIPSGVLRYIKEGRMVWPLAWVVVIGTLPGVLAGAYLRVRYLPDPRNFKLFAGLVLLYIGGKLLWVLLRLGKPERQTIYAEEAFQQRMRDYARQQKESGQGQVALPRTVTKKFTCCRIVYEFYGQEFDLNAPAIMALSLVVGLVGGVYGIGGGAIIAPFFVSIFGLPVYTVAGAALLGTLVTSVAGVLFYLAMAPCYPAMAIAPDWSLGLLFGLGGMAGMYCGARLQKHMPAKAIKWILAASILCIAVKYMADFLRP